MAKFTLATSKPNQNGEFRIVYFGVESRYGCKAFHGAALARLSPDARIVIFPCFRAAVESMRFTLIDRITDLHPGERITAVKGLTMAEDYLQDHFPLFPVMPGVMMLEALYQSSAWLIRASDNFSHSMVQLSEARNVTYKDFVQPGESLQISAKIHKRVDNIVTIQAEGTVSDRSAVKARLVLDCFNLAERGLASDRNDQFIIQKLKREFDNLCGLALARP